MSARRLLKHFIRAEAPQFLTQVRARFVEVRVAQVAGSLAFTTLLSLVPLLTVVIAITSQFRQFATWSSALRGFLVDNLLPDRAGKVIATYAIQFSQKASNLTILGLILLIVTALMLLVTVERTFNGIWVIRRNRRWWVRVPTYWAILTVGPLLLAAIVAVMSQVVTASLGVVNEPLWVRTLVLRLAPALLLVGFFTYLFHAVPHRRLIWWHSLAGGLIAGLGVVLIQRLLGLYLKGLPNFALIYGTFSVLPIFLLWLYLSWTVILLGAIVAAVLPDFLEHRGLLPDSPTGRIHAALRLVVALAEAQHAGQTRPVEQLARRAGLTVGRCEVMLEDMRQAGWVVRADSSEWVLSISAQTLRLGDVISQVAMGALPQDARCVDAADQSLIDAAVRHVRAALDVPVLELVQHASPAVRPAAPEILVQRG